MLCVTRLFTSALGPHTVDGTGPGGYAGYYLKTGYGSRETNECQNDNQAVGSKTCAQSQPQYYQGTGRCGLACSNDSLNGNIAWAAGGACKAGYTKNNKWQRASAMSACVNATCPSFTPIHKLQNGTLCPKYTAPDNAYLQDFSAATPNFPDQNGTWGSYFTNPTSGSGWLTRLLGFYVPVVLNGPVVYTDETVTCAAATIALGSVIVFDTLHYPVDDSAAITLKTLDGVTTYLINVDFTLNPRTGAFVFNSGITTPVVASQQLKISYTKKGHNMDGIFMDTIDSADVYPLTGASMASMINSIKTSIGEKWLLSNRGFSNLDGYIKSCKGVMFESWLVDYNFNTGVYSKITDPNSIAYNDTVNTQLLKLRGENTFDVYSLNYCQADSSGDSLRTYIREEDAKRGYLSWSSTIELNVPSANAEVPTPSQKIKSNVYKRFKIKSI